MRLAIEPSLRTDHVVRPHAARRRRSRRARRDRRHRRPRQLLDGARLRGHGSAVRRPDRRRAVRRRHLRHAERAVPGWSRGPRRRRPPDPERSSKPPSTPGTPARSSSSRSGPRSRPKVMPPRCGEPWTGPAPSSRRCFREPRHRVQRRRDLGDARPARARPAARRRGAAGRGDRASATATSTTSGATSTPRGAASSPRSPVTRSSGASRRSPRQPPRSGVSHEGDRVAVRDIVIDRERLPDLRPRLLGRTRARDSTAASPSTWSCCPGSMVYRLREDRSAEELTVFEPLSCAVTWVAPVSERRHRAHRGARPHGHGDDRRRARRRRLADHRHRRVARPVPPRLRAAGSAPTTSSTSNRRTLSRGSGRSPAGRWPTS